MIDIRTLPNPPSHEDREENARRFKRDHAETAEDVHGPMVGVTRAILAGYIIYIPEEDSLRLTKTGLMAANESETLPRA